MKTPPKKAAKPEAKRDRTASDTRRTGVTPSADEVATRGAKDTTPDLRDFETQARVDIRVPTDAHVIGEPVTVTALRNPGLTHVGLLATCQRGEHTYEVGLADVVFAAGSPAAQLVSEYRAWLGLPTGERAHGCRPAPAEGRERRHRRRKACRPRGARLQVERAPLPTAQFVARGHAAHAGA